MLVLEALVARAVVYLRDRRLARAPAAPCGEISHVRMVCARRPYDYERDGECT